VGGAPLFRPHFPDLPHTQLIRGLGGIIEKDLVLYGMGQKSICIVPGEAEGGLARSLVPKEIELSRRNLIGGQGRTGYLDHRPYQIIDLDTPYSITAFAIRRMITF
jgi:hypothetical protein